jgi:hypothetical protein
MASATDNLAKHEDAILIPGESAGFSQNNRMRSLLAAFAKVGISIAQ